MDNKFIAFMVVALLVMFILGFRSSYSTGIQPGYFEKAEAPAYGVGGTTAVEGLSEEAEKYFKQLYKEIEE